MKTTRIWREILIQPKKKKLSKAVKKGKNVNNQKAQTAKMMEVFNQNYDVIYEKTIPKIQSYFRAYTVCKSIKNEDTKKIKLQCIIRRFLSIKRTKNLRKKN